MTTPQISNENEILDSTQNAILNVADEVSNAISHNEHEIFYQSPEFWVGVAFVLVVVLLIKPVGKLLRNMLTSRIDTITKRIHDAANLKDDAEKMLADYEKKFKNVQQEATAILQKSEREIDFIKKENLAKLERDMKRKEQEATTRLESAKVKAQQEITALASSLSVNTIKQVLSEKLDSKDKSHLIDKSIDFLSKK